MTATTTYTYDSSGNLILEKIDQNSDGIAESVITYNLITQTTDSNADGNTDTQISNTYDTKGNLTSQSYDNNADYAYTYTYDANGNRTSAGFDNDQDGTIDEINYTAIFDTKGNKIFQTQYALDGGDSETTLFTYDTRGKKKPVMNRLFYMSFERYLSY